MFLFGCCTEVENKDNFEIRVQQQTQQNYTIYKTKDPAIKHPFKPQTQVLKIKKSDYQQLIKLYKPSQKLWEDIEFTHNEKSLGKIQGITHTPWKRLSDIIPNPVLFDGRIQPQDAIQGQLGDCYFLSAVSALAQKQHRIKSIFGKQELIKNGIYRVTLRIDGVIQEIIVDDYVPVNIKGEPIFCQPHKNEIWVPILEKAWAKANGSYANIIAGSPSQIFRATTYAPAQTIEIENKEETDHIWKVILENARMNRPCCCGTDDSNQIDWDSLHLVPGHAYTLIDATELQLVSGRKVRMLKLRNPWGNTEWMGQGCETDKKFWSSVVNSQSKNMFLKGLSMNNDGMFYIRFKDFSEYFAQAHISYMQQQGNYTYEIFEPSPKRGVHWVLTIFQEGQYWIGLHQNGVRDQQHDQSILARGTLMISKNKEPNGYEFVDGILCHYRQDSAFKAHLKPGKYTIFSKYDANTTQRLPEQASVSIYSQQYSLLEQANPLASKIMLKECMLNHAIATKRRKYQNDTLWVSWKLMYKEGGYAYICFGAQKNSQHKWFVSFNQSDFTEMHYKLKKPWKNRGEGQSFQVNPGEQKIIIARVKNDNPTNLKFPPKLTYKIQPLN